MLVTVGISLALVGMLAAAGFIVVAQRRRRQLGLLAAIGAPDGLVRLALVANGTIVGAIGTVIGTTIGIGAWILAAPTVERAVNHRVDRFDLPVLMIAVVVLAAIVAATVAAWWPARAAARVPVMDALSDRPHDPGGGAPVGVHRGRVVRGRGSGGWWPPTPPAPVGHNRCC